MNAGNFSGKSAADGPVTALAGDALLTAYEALRAENAALAQRVSELEDEICRDVLTPVFNRRHFRVELGHKLQQCKRYGRQSALLFVDVDNLKQINDRYGHVAGDEALVAIARILLGNVRSCDLVARIGGDEFALVLDSIGAREIPAKVAALSGRIAAYRPAFADEGFCLSATFGHAFLQPQDEIDDVIARADKAMYEVKAARRAAG